MNIKTRLQRLENSQTMPTAYSVQVFDVNGKPTRPLTPPANTVAIGALIFVIDLNQVQVSNGTSWLPLN